MSAPRIAIVLPCYNEQEALPISAPRILALLDSMAAEGLISADSYVLCSNDGSRDDTWRVIEELHLADKRIKGISLAHNRGHQYALLAGLMEVRGHCDAAVSIDADLQDDPEAIREMVKAFRAGKEIVYGVRSSRETDTWFKRNTAHAFYRFQERMGLETVYDHADYRLMSARALELLADYGESNLFLRGIVPQIGLDTAVVTYARAPRVAGESKYPLAKMLAFSVDGITSFSARPIRLIFYTGLILLVIDLVVAAYVLYSHFFREAMSGWASLMLSIWFLGSLVLMGIGVVGEYIGKIFTEVKKRPRYALRDRLID
ncbi:MAG: glycosyltransferase family 2 protein [Candidatus Amulumruptor caecigallinarius]|nr:glycosyltransferase family 2 protein [Candidatus Amulumruptor caecigallinarius]MCM1396020.1 glycosyltransferase family 2 protein [Candidatus Amulumruptor caecigallinarius]MCM1453019.1 glycosyltransferase family 2 protein [bacterium]